jgi:hypothetical protein
MWQRAAQHPICVNAVNATCLEAAVYGDEDLLGRLVGEAVERPEHLWVHAGQRTLHVLPVIHLPRPHLLGQAEVDLLREENPGAALRLLRGPAAEGAEALRY